MVGRGGSSAGSYLADPTSPIPSYCASIVLTSTVRVKTRLTAHMLIYVPVYDLHNSCDTKSYILNYVCFLTLWVFSAVFFLQGCCEPWTLESLCTALYHPTNPMSKMCKPTFYKEAIVLWNNITAILTHWMSWRSFQYAQKVPEWLIELQIHHHSHEAACCIISAATCETADWHDMMKQ